MTFRKYMQKINDSRLFKAFEELQECADTGILADGETRQLKRKYEEIYDTHFALKDIEKEIYYEMAMRYYGMKKVKIRYSFGSVLTITTCNMED